MENIEKIADFCDQEVLQLKWKPEIGDTFYVRETKPYNNYWFGKIATIAIVRRTVSHKQDKTQIALRVGVKDRFSNSRTFFLVSQNTWIPSTEQLLDMLFNGDEGWVIGNANDLASFLNVLGAFSVQRSINNFYELLLRFTLSECLNIET